MDDDSQPDGAATSTGRSADAVLSAPDHAPLDITNCDREPIHISGAVQPHGALLVLQEPQWDIVQASLNVESLFGMSHAALLGQSLESVLGPEQCARLADALSGQALDGNPLYTFTPRVNGAAFNAIAHRRDGLLILELEHTSQDSDISFTNLYPVVRESIAELQQAATFEELCRVCAMQVRHITGFDKVMIYQFDEEWTGTVVAEDKAAEMDEYMGLKFPASDIPRQARELYLLNRLRLIADVEYSPVPILPARNPLTDAPLDLTFSTLRSVSPIHIEYLKNMQVGASMSISIVRDGRLWGLIACHHRTALAVPYEARTGCEFLGQVFALQLGARERDDRMGRRLRLKSIQARLLGAMAGHDDWVEGLVGSEADLLEFANAQGAAICFNGTCRLIGETPTESEVQQLAVWLGSRWKRGVGSAQEAVFQTDSLQAHHPEASAFGNSASGLMGIEVSEVTRSSILWFRPEVVRTVKWSGNPEKPVEIAADGQMHLHPRKSFAMWKEMVHGKSLPWQDTEVEAVADFRASVIGIVLRRAERLAQLNEKLQQTNNELASFSYSVSHDLRAPFRHITGFANLLEKRIGSTVDETSLRYLHTMRDSAKYAGTLVDNLLSFSQMGRNQLRIGAVDMNTLVHETIRDVMGEGSTRVIDWEVAPLPPVQGDPEMLRLVLRNLLSNAVKYSAPREQARIEIGCRDDEQDRVLWVRDNGVGFDMRYVSKLFGVFQRLHSNEDFEGTGIGLANVKRIVERHGGSVWAESEVDLGSCFYFSLPREPLVVNPADAKHDDIT